MGFGGHFFSPGPRWPVRPPMACAQRWPVSDPSQFYGGISSPRAHALRRRPPLPSLGRRHPSPGYLRWRSKDFWEKYGDFRDLTIKIEDFFYHTGDYICQIGFVGRMGKPQKMQCLTRKMMVNHRILGYPIFRQIHLGMEAVEKHKSGYNEHKARTKLGMKPLGLKAGNSSASTGIKKNMNTFSFQRIWVATQARSHCMNRLCTTLEPPKQIRRAVFLQLATSEWPMLLQLHLQVLENAPTFLLRVRQGDVALLLLRETCVMLGTWARRAQPVPPWDASNLGEKWRSSPENMEMIGKNRWRMGVSPLWSTERSSKQRVGKGY